MPFIDLSLPGVNRDRAYVPLDEEPEDLHPSNVDLLVMVKELTQRVAALEARTPA